MTLSRRRLIQCACCAPAASAFGGLPFAAVADGTTPKTTMTADQALAELRRGNEQFITDAPFRAAVGRERRLELALSQAPFVVLVSCSDSRVPPELLFGRGLGEMFIVRNAGNTVDTTALGSIEYAISQLGVPLIVVMGHERCGAVAAAVDVVENDTLYTGAIGQMIEPIIPAVLTARSGGETDLLARSVRGNVSRTVARLRSAFEPELARPQADGRLKIVGAYYTLADGVVDFFDA